MTILLLASEGAVISWQNVFRSAWFLHLQAYHCITDKQTESLLLSLRWEMETLTGHYPINEAEVVFTRVYILLSELSVSLS